MRHLQKDTGSVARVLLAATGAAMLEIQEHLNRLLDYLVGSLPLDIDNKARSARIVLVARIV